MESSALRLQPRCHRRATLMTAPAPWSLLPAHRTAPYTGGGQGDRVPVLDTRLFVSSVSEPTSPRLVLESLGRAGVRVLAGCLQPVTPPAATRRCWWHMPDSRPCDFWGAFPPEGGFSSQWAETAY